MRIACESVADNELCPLNALASALTAGRRMTSHMDMLRRSNKRIGKGRGELASNVSVAKGVLKRGNSFESSC
jgi:hypothetical protein